MRLLAPLAAVLLAAGLLAGCGGKKSATSTTTAATANGCTVISSPPKMAADNQSKPTSSLDPSKTYVVTMKTNCGTFAFKIDQAQSPNASASFVNLVQKGFFDNTVFHRIVPGFIIQGGDPTGTGTGGPGYETVDTPPAGATLHARRRRDGEGRRRGARDRRQPVLHRHRRRTPGLPPDYAIIGKVTKGLDVVDRIGLLGDAQEQPTQIVEIESATVASS